MEKYDDLVFCRERTSQARSVYAPKNSVVIFFHTKSITYNYVYMNVMMKNIALLSGLLRDGLTFTVYGRLGHDHNIRRCFRVISIYMN